MATFTTDKMHSNIYSSLVLKKKYLQSAVYVLLVLCNLFFLNNCLAQEIHSQKIYTQEDGLTSGTLRFITKDSTGFLWITSENGVSRFDGYAFSSFRHHKSDISGLSSSDIVDVGIHSTGKMFIQTANSISIYNPVNQTFKSLYRFKQLNEIKLFGITNSGCFFKLQDSLKLIDAQNDKVYSLKIIDSNSALLKAISKDDLKSSVWFSHEKNIVAFVWQKKALYILPITNAEYAQMKNMPNRIFSFNETVAFYTEQGLFSFDFEKQKFLKITDNAFASKNKYHVNSQMQSGRFIISSKPYDHVCAADMISGKEYVFELNKLIGNVNTVAITGIFPGKNETFWISTSTGDIFKINPPVGLAEHFNPTTDPGNQFNESTIEYIFEDDNVLWLASTGLGLVKRKKINRALPHYIPPPKESIKPFDLYKNVRTISQLDSQNILVGTLAGLTQFNLKSKKFSNYIHGFSDTIPFNNLPVSKILNVKDSILYIANWGNKGIYRIDKKNRSIVQIHPNQNFNKWEFATIRTIFLDSRGTLWVGTDANLIYKINTLSKKFETEKFYGNSSGEDPLLFNVVFTFAEALTGEILIGTQDGFYSYDYSNKKIERFKINSKNQTFINEDNIRSIYVDKRGLIWVGSYGGGLSRFDDKKNLIKIYTTDNGLPDNTIYSITDDSKGTLWLGTNKGICRFNISSENSRNYTLRDGIQNNEFNTNAGCKLNDGTIVLGGINGINVFQPESFEPESDLPKVVITQFKAGETNLPLADSVINLRYNQNYLSFQFAALNFYRNDENKYAYKLNGLDKNWIYIADRRFTSYANVPPGNYKFEVKALNYEGNWSNITSLSFSVATPWYKSWWFTLALLVFLISITTLLFRYRLNQQLKIQEVRNRIASDLHDEIGSTLSSVHIYSEVALKTIKEKAPEAVSYLNKISIDTSGMIDALNDIVWTVNSKNDRFENIINKMRVTAIELFEARSIQTELDIDESLNVIKMGMIDRKNFYLFFKEAINNVAKYSKGSLVLIKLKYENNNIKLMVEDNGVGFNLNDKHKGNGIPNMNKRASDLKGLFRIESAKNKGTIISLVFPYS